MGRETKVGLVVGLCFIVCFAILLSHRGRPPAPPDQDTFEIATVFRDVPLATDESEVGRATAQGRTRQQEFDGASQSDGPTRRESSGSRRRSGRIVPQRWAEGGARTVSIDLSPVGARSEDAGDDRFTSRGAPIDASASINDVLQRRRQPAEGLVLVRDDGEGEPLRLIQPAPREAVEPSRKANTESAILAATQAAGDTGSAAAESAGVQSAGTEYEIRPGDSLSRIAAAHYGSSSPAIIQRIFAANQDRLASPDQLVVGRTILLPPAESSNGTVIARAPTEVESGPAASQSDRTATVAAATYVVRSGDVLGRIAKAHYGSASKEIVEAIYAANRDVMTSPDQVVAGSELKLPVLPGISSPARDEAPLLADAGRPQESVTSRETAAQAPGSKSSKGREGVDWQWYQLKKNDVYSKVAARLLGTSKRWRELAEMNQDIFPDANQIRSGVRIRVPIENRPTTTTRAGSGDA